MSLTIDVKIIPQSGKQNIVIDKSGTIKIYLKSEPKRNKANIELIKFLSKKFNLLETDIKILAGLKTRKKKIKINLNLNFDIFLKKFNIDSR